MTARRERRLTKQVVVRVEPALYEWLDAVAVEGGRTVAQTVRWLLWQAKDG